MALKLNSSGGGSVTLDAPVTANNYTLTAPASSGTIATTDGGNTTFTSITDSGNLTFTGTGNRITGDFSNATASNRVVFQTSTTNGSTYVNAQPNGTGNNAAFEVLDRSGDSTNCSRGNMQIITGSEFTLRSAISGTGTYLPMTFYTGGSERMRMDTSGNVGIGTNSPTAYANYTGVTITGTTGGFTKLKSSTNAVTANISADGSVSVVAIGSDSNHPIIFTTYGTERMRIDSNGTAFFGKSAQSATTEGNMLGLTASGYHYNESVSTNADGSLALWYLNRQSSDGQIFSFRKASAAVGSITVSASATAYNTSSDYRLKENIQPMQNALDVVAQLNPVTYTWKADGSDGQGFIAHELQAVVPDCVTGEKDAVDAEGNPVYQGIDTSFLVATLAKAIQEQQEQINQLKAEVAALKGA